MHYNNNTIFLFVHLAWTHLPHVAHSTELDITLVPLMPQGPILLPNISSSIPLTINFVFPRLSLNSSIVSPFRPSRLL